MTDDEARKVRDQVVGYLNSKDGHGLDIGNPAHLALLVDRVHSELEGVAGDDLFVVVAMCWLGPKDASHPPPAVRDELLATLRQYVPDEAERRDRVMEFAIAYGCGKWREIQNGYGEWGQRWQGAMRGLVRALEPAVAQANRWLAQHVVGFPKDRSTTHGTDFPEDLWSDAWILASRLVRPEYPFFLEDEDRLTMECTSEGTELSAPVQEYQMMIPPGAKAAWVVKEQEGTVILPQGSDLSLTSNATVLLLARDDDSLIKINAEAQGQQARLKVGEDASIEGPMTLAMWECTCGTTHCMERHRLEAWNPTQIVQKTAINDQQQKTDGSLTLWDYVASAVKGPQASMKTGAFVQGVYFPLLAQEGLTA